MKKKLICFTLLSAMLFGGLSLLSSCEKASDSSSNKQSESSSVPGSENSSSNDSSISEESPNESSTPEDSVSSEDSSPSEDTPIVIPETYYTSASGSFEEKEGVLTSKSTGSLAYRNDGETFTEGTLSCDIKLNGNKADNGLVFGIKNDSNLTYYWENANIYYYFFFISNAGTAYLGKVSNTSWIVCGETVIPHLDRNVSHKLEVSRENITNGTAIRCYVDGQLYVSYKDYSNYDGTGYGVRAGAANVAFSNIAISDEILGSAVSLEGYIVANGAFENKNGAITSTTGNAIAEKENGEFVYGYLEATMNTNGKQADNGIIFSLTANETHTYWESDVSYYFFFINFSGGAYLGKVDFGTWTACQYAPISGYNPNNSYTLKVEKDDTTINCYINNSLYFTHADSFPLEGTGYGLRAGGSDVSYTNINCKSSGTVVETYPDDLDTIKGKVVGTNGAARAKTNETLALLKDKTLKEGTFQANVKGVSTKRSGLVFNYTNDGTNESYYRFVTRKEAQKVEIDKVVNGTVTNLYSNYLSAGYGTGVEYLFKVVIVGNEAYCYFWNTLYYVAEITPIEGRIGLYAEGPSSQFRNYATSTSTDTIKVDTLLFGHSYFELWGNYRNDFASVASTYNLGTYTNIGIGGSVASHWEKFKESLVKYDADTVVYMIGINDLTGGTSPASVVGSIKDTLAYMKEANPNLKVVLLSVNHCPARSTIRANISATNELMKTYCAQHEWISYAEMEYAFCDNGSTPDSYWFTDGLHPTAAGYVQKIVPAIKDALDGKNQPTLDDEQQQALLTSAKDLKLCQLFDYDEYAYLNNEWNTAKPIYEAAVKAVNDCTTVKQVEELDLSSYINQLEEIKSLSDYAYDSFIGGSNNSVWETPNFTSAINSSTNGSINLLHDGHRIDNTYQYSDLSFNFCLSDLVGETPTTSIVFRGSQTPYLGMNGYLLNIVTEPNYLQIWYMADAYGSNPPSPVLTYIGGWVFPNEVENTTFKVIVDGNYVYIYTLEDFLNKGKEAYGCSVDLTNGGKFAPYTTGGVGVLNWTNNFTTKSKLTISNLRGTITNDVDTPVITNNHTDTVNNALANNTSIHGFNTTGIVSKENGTFTGSGCAYKLHTGLDIIDSSFSVTASNATADVGVAGFLFRSKKNAEHDGIDGYLFNYVANASNQFIQIYYLQNCYNTDGSALLCDYIGGWVFPSKVIGTTFHASVEGNLIRIYTDSYPTGVTVNLTGSDVGKSYTAHTSGGFGVISWQEGLSIDLTFNNIEE